MGDGSEVVERRWPNQGGFGFAGVEEEGVQCVWFGRDESQTGFDPVNYKRVLGWERVSNAAYNILNRECSPVKNLSAPVYITIGDGDNIEGFRSTLSEVDEKLLISGDDGILMDLGMSFIQTMHMETEY
ncbi:purple acid phosphatase 2 [Artemisia annua]|uniref:Purple acid phosphatase 2 n=1 Tax=Artemisia annua TaxID=35608 RepID=A0A2U1MK98_ARTAN|nr:purple acid phosphatase 2 [Artemisia annua]